MASVAWNVWFVLFVELCIIFAIIIYVWNFRGKGTFIKIFVMITFLVWVPFVLLTQLDIPIQTWYGRNVGVAIEMKSFAAVITTVIWAHLLSQAIRMYRGETNLVILKSTALNVWYVIWRSYLLVSTFCITIWPKMDHYNKEEPKESQAPTEEPSVVPSKPSAVAKRDVSITIIQTPDNKDVPKEVTRPVTKFYEPGRIMSILYRECFNQSASQSALNDYAMFLQDSNKVYLLSYDNDLSLDDIFPNSSKFEAIILNKDDPKVNDLYAKIRDNA